VFPNEKRELSAGRRVGYIKRRSSGLRKKVGQAAENGSPPAALFYSPAYCAAHWSVP